MVTFVRASGLALVVLSRREPTEQAATDQALTVELTPMRRRHLRSVLRIEALVYPRPWSVSVFTSELALRSSRAYFVARSGGLVMAYCGLMFAGEDAHITTVAVDPSFQRHKIGTQMMLHMARIARHRGARNLTLEVRVGNRGAQSMYHRFGFAPAGVRENYYAESNEDALVMWACDINSAEYGRRLAEIESSLAIPAV